MFMSESQVWYHLSYPGVLLHCKAGSKIEDHASQRLLCIGMIGLFQSITLPERMPTPIRLNRIVTSTWISHHSLVSDSWYLSIAWRGYLEGLYRLLNKLRHNLHHIGYLAYLLQRLMWQPTIALSTFDLTYHTRIIELIVINSTRLFPAWKSEAYRGLLTLPNVFIIQTHHA